MNHQRRFFGILCICMMLLPITTISLVDSTKQEHIHAFSLGTTYEYDDEGNVFFDQFSTDVHTDQDLLCRIGLPDLKFNELRCWWGPVNTSSIGLFVRYAVKNIADTYEGTDIIQANLTFYADDNTSRDRHQGWQVRPASAGAHGGRNGLR